MMRSSRTTARGQRTRTVEKPTKSAGPSVQDLAEGAGACSPAQPKSSSSSRPLHLSLRPNGEGELLVSELEVRWSTLREWVLACDDMSPECREWRLSSIVAAGAKMQSRDGPWCGKSKRGR